VSPDSLECLKLVLRVSFPGRIDYDADMLEAFRCSPAIREPPLVVGTLRAAGARAKSTCTVRIIGTAR
jgi:hypothetical protein